MLTFTKKVIRAFKHYDFESLFIIGRQGSGKTTYALLVLYEVYRDWDEALNHLFFDPKPALTMFKDALREGHRIPLVVFDDAGFHLSKYLWYIDRRLTMLFNAFYNLIRTVCAGVIFTSPDMDIIKELQKKSWWVGEPRAPHGRSDPRRYMVLYRKTIAATGKVYVSKRAVDEYRLDIIPGEVRKRYEEARREAMIPLLEKLSKRFEMFERMGDRKPRELAEELGQYIEGYPKNEEAGT